MPRRREYERRIVLALRTLRDDGELKNAAGREPWVWLHSTDDSDGNLDERTFAQLQPDDIAAEFRNRFDGATGTLLARLSDRS